MDRGLSVGEVAALTGLSIRTLHHYDEVGLVVPERRTQAGHRRYGVQSLSRLHRVLAYRELDFSLVQIHLLLDDPDTYVDQQLRDQRDELDGRITRLVQVRDSIDKVLEAHAMGITLEPHELFEVFGDESPTQHAAEAEERWGDTEPFAESQRRTSRMTKDDWLRFRTEQDDVLRHIIEVFDSGEPADSVTATTSIDAHRALIDTWFYPCSKQMHVKLSEMYVADDRFRRYYDQHRVGLAQYVHDVIAANAGCDTAGPDG